MSDEYGDCPDCGAQLKELDVDSEKMNAYCPECAPALVLNSPAVTGEPCGQNKDKVWTQY